MQATALLEKQHRGVESIFRKLEIAESEHAAALVTELADELAAHMAIEQAIFYPAVRQIDPDLVSESYEEHALAELALKRLLATEPGDASFSAKITALKELIALHVGEEEEDLFPEVERSLDYDQLEALGDAMKSAFEDALAEGHAALLPKGFSTTSADDAQQTPVRRSKSGNHRVHV